MCAKKLFLIFLSISMTPYASMFIVTDKRGNVLQKKNMIPCNNAFLNQNATEYSHQAIFDELHKQEHLALRAEAARKHLEHIAQEKEAAKQRGETYKLSAVDQARLIEDAKYFNGGKYVWGGTTPRGFDCSGYVQYLFKKHSVKLPRTAWSQSKLGHKIALANLKTGDLLFFNTDKKRGIPVSHVGIYMGNGKFIHAASRKKGIIISPLAGHYQECFVVAKRIIKPSSKTSK
ncbi:MAG: C40 family peptidase, partial [Campylobacterota bacterium]|nr:C40 family peptidase [Campylobacterota bacterium]